jgi:hypothetical protein
MSRFLLLIIAIISIQQVSRADILLYEPFNSPTLPTGWTNTAIQGTDLWFIRNAPAFSSPSGGNYAVFDDNLLGAASIPNEAALATPILDCSNRTAVYLSYTHHWFGIEFTHGYVEISTNGGTTWGTIMDYHKQTRGSLAAPQDTIIDISAWAANQSSVQVRFRYTDGMQAGRYWYLDDVKIYADPDVGVTALITPEYLDCSPVAYTTTETVSVAITNHGVNPVSNIPVSCVVSGGTTATLTGTLTGPLAAGATDTFTFAVPIDMSADAVYDFVAYTHLGTDEYLNNDTLITSRQQLVITYPYTQNFDGSTAGWFATGQSPPTNGNRNFVHGNLPYLNGPQGQGDSWYVHTTASNNGTFIWVESPIFDFSALANPQLSFDIKHSLHSSDYFQVQYSTNGGATWTQLGNGPDPFWYNGTNWWRNSLSAPVDSWTRVQHNLCVLAGESCVQFRIYGRPFYSEPTYTAYHYFAFDNVLVEDGPDVGVTAYLEPIDLGCLFGTAQNVTVRVENYSCAPLTNVPIECSITGAITQTLTGTVPGPIPVGGFVNYTFPTTFNMTAVGTYNFETYTQLAGDIVPANDTLNTNINVTNLKVTTYPYLEDFNAGPAFWNASGQNPPLNGNRNFVLGNIPYLNGPQGEGDSWYVETTASNNGTFIWVESPVFDFSNLTNPTLSMDIKHSLHSSDYFQVRYSIDGGATWTQLGGGPDPLWYNGTNWWRNSLASPVDAWTHVEQELCQLSGEPCVKFQIYGRPFYSEPTYTGYHYFAFDNFMIDAGEPDDIAVEEIILADAGDCGPFGATETIEVLIKNNTCRPLYDVPVELQLNGGAVISEIMPGPIPRFGTYIYTFTNTLDLSPAAIHNITVTTQLATDTFPANDQLTENRYSSSVINTFPYAEDFNANNGGWVSRTAINHRYFHWDTLAYLNGPQGEGKSWYVETVQSNNGTFIWVESPVFDFTNLVDPQLTFDLKHSLHSSDYFQVQYSINGGATWTQLGNGSDPYWYNGTNWWRNSLSNPVDAWTQVQHSLCAAAGESCVKLRFYGRPFYSEPTYTGYHYFAFDNVEIKDGPDVGVVAYVDPIDLGCLFATNQQVTVEVYNFSCTPISNVPIQCDVTGQTTATLTGTVPGPIPAGGSVNYTFPTTINMTAVGTYNFNSYTQLAGDINPDNDDLQTTINVVGLKVTTFPYLEDFNSGNAYWFAGGQNPPLNGNRNFVLGNIPYLNGPQGEGDSWYVETTASNNGTFIWVESPVFDFSNLTNPTLSMDIKHSLHSSDYFQVQYSTNGGATWTQLGGGPDPLWYNGTNWWRNSLSAPVDAWTHVEQGLCQLSGEPCVKFRIYGRPFYSEPTYTGYHYFAFDNFMIDDGDPDDMEPVEIILSDAGDCNPFGATETISVLLKNNTCRPLYNVPIDLQLNGGAAITEVMPGPIPRFGNYIYTFTTTLDLSATGVQNITVTTQLPTDSFPANDQLTENRFSSMPIAAFPYNEDFNTTNGGWVSRTSINHRYFHWDSLNYLNGPQGEGKSWFVETTASNNGTFVWVESPIFDFSSMTNPQLIFDLKHSLHSSDYFQVQYSINGGATWTQLGNGSSPDWYNGTNWWRNSLSNPVDEWTRVQHSLCPLIGQSCVKFRFYGRPFYSEPTYTGYHYFAIDNIEIREGNDVGVISYIEPVDDGCLFTTTQPVSVEVYNFGCGPVSNIPVECQINGVLNTTLTGTVPGPIPAGGSVIYTFPTTIDMTPIGVYNFDCYTQDPLDFNLSNDTLATSINVEQITITTFPYFEDFNSGPAYWLASGQSPPNNGNRNFVHGALPYLNGPQGQGDSWYVETTASNNGTFIWVESPVFDFSTVTNPKMLFDLKHSLHSSDYFQVQYSTNGGATWTQLGNGSDPYWYNSTNWWRNSLSTPLDEWTTHEFPLCNLIGEPCVKFRFYGRPFYSEPTYTGYHYFAFDNFHITDTHIDAEVALVEGCFGSQYDMEVSIFNNDRLCLTSPDITSLDITYSVNGGAPVTQTFTGLNIPFGSVGSVMVPGVTVPNQSSVVAVWATNPNGQADHIFENDTAYTNTANWPDCNDHCSNATSLGLGTTTASQTSNATQDGNEDPSFANCGSITVENTVWYQFTTNNSGDSVVVYFENQVCAPSQNGIQISIDSADTACDPSTYTNLYCSATGDTAAVTWGPQQLAPNTTYYIAIDGFAGSDCSFDIRIEGAVDPILLPTELIGFNLNCSPIEGVEIRWLTASEEGTDYFEVERSSNALTFETVGRMEAAGQSDHTQSYYLKDLYAPSGQLYYRIKQVDLNGNITYSEVKTIECNQSNGNFNVFPNPNEGSFVVETLADLDDPIEVRIYNALGQVVYEEFAVANSTALRHAIDLDDFASGVYMLEFKVGARAYTEKVIVQFD